jgi:hypothetical protein
MMAPSNLESTLMTQTTPIAMQAIMALDNDSNLTR